MTRILFVCHGNICRSPMAEFCFADLVREAGRAGDFAVESAATTSEELGNPVYPPARRELAAHGICCDGKRARRVTRADYSRFDRIVGMDAENRRDLLRLFGGDPEHKVSLLLDWTAAPRDVSDPWYTGDFDATWRDVLSGCKAILAAHPAGGHAPRRFFWPMDEAALAQFAEIVRGGGVAVVPTDTVYGVVAASGNAEALARIVAAKGRDPAKPCQLLAASREAAERAGVLFPPSAAAAADAFWPGALTLVLDKSGGGTEGVRVPDHAAARALCAAAGGLLRCTSANHSGEPPAVTPEAALASLPGADAIVEAGRAPGGLSSTVAGFGPDGKPHVFREGPVSAMALLSAMM